MTPYAQNLLTYTMSQGMNNETAATWLDEHTPGWREHNEPQAQRRDNNAEE